MTSVPQELHSPEQVHSWADVEVCEHLVSYLKQSIETCILSSVKEIASPGWMHETSARGWTLG